MFVVPPYNSNHCGVQKHPQYDGTHKKGQRPENHKGDHSKHNGLELSDSEPKM
jgi:hypothetical protein